MKQNKKTLFTYLKTGLSEILSDDDFREVVFFFFFREVSVADVIGLEVVTWPRRSRRV